MAFIFSNLGKHSQSKKPNGFSNGSKVRRGYAFYKEDA